MSSHICKKVTIMVFGFQNSTVVLHVIVIILSLYIFYYTGVDV